MNTRPGILLMVLVILSAVVIAGPTVAVAAVNESAQVDLTPASSAYLGSSGGANLHLFADDMGTQSFSVEARASGLLSDATYHVWVGGTPVGSATTDDLGGFLFAAPGAVSFPTLLGLEVWIVEGADMAGLIALAGRITGLVAP